MLKVWLPKMSIATCRDAIAAAGVLRNWLCSIYVSILALQTKPKLPGSSPGEPAGVQRSQAKLLSQIAHWVSGVGVGKKCPPAYRCQPVLGPTLFHPGSVT